MPVLTMLFLFTACTGLSSMSTFRYPRTQRVAVTDDFHGTQVADPYRWLEDLDSRRTHDWITAENAIAAPYLEALPQRPAIHARLAQLFSYERFGVPRKAGARYFYLRNDGKQNQAALHVATAPADVGRVLIDPGSIRGDATVALADYVPSPDGRWLAYALSDAGSDWKSWHVRDVDSGADRTDVLRFTKFTRVSWARDGSGFYYGSYSQGDDHKQPVIHFHQLGQSQEQDQQVFAITDHPTRVPDGEVTLDGRFLVITLDDGTLSNGISVLPLDGSGVVMPLFARFDGLYQYLGSRQGVGTELLFSTTAGASRGSVIAVDLGKPVASRQRLIVPQAADVLEHAALVGDRVIATYLKDARAQVQLFDAASARHLLELQLPGLGTVSGFTGDATDTESFFSYTDFSTPTQVFQLDLASGRTTALRTPQIPADVSAYVTEQVFYASKDGTRIPMFLVHRRDLKKDGDTPVMLYGYGGFNISLTPGFSPATLVWLEMGGIYAVANLRGGGEYGAAWHLAGTRSAKQNVFDDFFAAAEYLIGTGYTRPERIVIRGGSNGGLLVGAAITQRPELFGAALPDVGVLDMLRYHLASANARQWSDDYGLSEDPADFAAQYAYSPYHNASRHDCYPPTLVTTASQDNRVVPWHSFKFAAALQAAQRCRNPVFIRVETRAGHGAGKPTWMQIDHYADQWAFAAESLRMNVPRLPKL